MARKAGGISPKREPSGRLSRSTAELIDAVTPAAAKRMRDDAATKYGDPLWGTETGRLFIAGQLSATQFECAKRWGRLVAEYHRVTGAPLPYPPAPGGGYAHVGDDPPITTPAGKALWDKHDRIKREMVAARHALAETGLDAMQAVRTCCESDDHHVGHVGLINLRAGLDRLARHWRLPR